MHLTSRTLFGTSALFRNHFLDSPFRNHFQSFVLNNSFKQKCIVFVLVLPQYCAIVRNSIELQADPRSEQLTKTPVLVAVPVNRPS